MSHNISYVSSLNGGTKYPVSGYVSLTNGDGGAQYFEDIFGEGTLSSPNCGYKCITKCSCNNANGWFAKAPTSGSYVTATTRRKYGITDTSSSSTGRTFAAAVAAPTPQTQTCYKSMGCKDGWFKEEPNKSYFSYNTEIQNGQTCYQVTGCKSPYTSSQEDDSIRPVATYSSQNYRCYPATYFLDFSYRVCSSDYADDKLEVKCTRSDGKNPTTSLEYDETQYNDLTYSIHGKKCDGKWHEIYVNGSKDFYGHTKLDSLTLFSKGKLEFSTGAPLSGHCQYDLSIPEPEPCDVTVPETAYTPSRSIWILKKTNGGTTSDCSKCPDGYFEEDPDSQWFTYSTTNINGTTCYYANGCRYPYIPSDSDGCGLAASEMNQRCYYAKSEVSVNVDININTSTTPAKAIISVSNANQYYGKKVTMSNCWLSITTGAPSECYRLVSSIPNEIYRVYKIQDFTLNPGQTISQSLNNVPSTCLRYIQPVKCLGSVGGVCWQ